ncbi:MAG: MFS transporter [Oscillospiraceae bacterium]|nr:MFS transporter [Oscillospiraceae bacterium]MDR2360315.1 MFS transporter [Oscillospiraceae bacterium]
MIKEKNSGYKWVILALMCFGIMSPQYAQFMLTRWGVPWLNDRQIFDNTAFVAISTAPLIAGVVLSLVSGVAVDRFGLKRVLIISYALSTAALVTRVWADSYEMMFICMVFSGVAATFFNSNQMKLIGRWFPKNQISLGLGIFVAFNNGSMALSSIAATLFPDYNTAFVSSAALSVVVLVMWFVFGKERPVVPAADETKSPPIPQCLKVAVKSRKLWITAIAMMLFQSSALTLSQFLPEALKNEYSDSEAALITGVFTFASMFGCMLAPKLLTKIGKLKVSFAIIGSLGAVGIAFAWRVPYLPLKLILLALLGFLTLGLTPILTALPLSFPEIGPTYAGTAGGFMATIMLAANVIIPRYITMPLAGNDYAKFFMFEGVIMLIFVFITPILPVIGKVPRRKLTNRITEKN